jgi:hypothetical protein
MSCNLRTWLAKELQRFHSKQNYACLEMNKEVSVINIVAYGLKARTVESKKQPLLGNARTQQYMKCQWEKKSAVPIG